MTKPLISAEYLRQRLYYDPATGDFTWLEKPNPFNDRIIKGWNGKCAGKLAGTSSPTGYITIGIDGVAYLAHRLAWLYTNGRWPSHLIDHINRIRTDNRISNLREATPMQNHLNCNRRFVAKSGHKGVHFHSKSNLYQARTQRFGKSYSFGYFKTIEEAAAAYKLGVDKLNSILPHNQPHTTV